MHSARLHSPSNVPSTTDTIVRLIVVYNQQAVDTQDRSSVHLAVAKITLIFQTNEKVHLPYYFKTNQAPPASHMMQ